jgi:glutathione peroxidase
MKFVRYTFRMLVDGSKARSDASSERTSRVATIAAIIAVVAAAGATWHFASDALNAALGSLSWFSDRMQDDAAGDLPPSPMESDRRLSVFDDDRVVAAVGPIANLACRKDDYVASTETSAPSDLGPPIEDKSATVWIDRNATTTSNGSLATPLSSPQFDVDDLLTRNLLAAGLSPVAALPAPDAANCPALLNHTFNKLQTGEAQSLCQFQGKVLLIVNTASYCAYTKQYEGLEAMYRKYRERGLVVVGFPSNDFGKQEPGSNQQIAEFCRTTYGVQFPMFEKSSVAKLSANPLYAELAAKTGAAPQWNFHKYVVDRNGIAVASFASDVTPDSPQLVALIERLLAEKYAAKS